MNEKNFERYCPKCNKKAEKCNQSIFRVISWFSTVKRIDIIYFLCSNCRLVYIDKSIVLKIISDFRRSLRKDQRKKLSHLETYQRILKTLEKDISEFRVNRLGYRKVDRFNKKPSKWLPGLFIFFCLLCVAYASYTTCKTYWTLFYAQLFSCFCGSSNWFFYILRKVV